MSLEFGQIYTFQVMGLRSCGTGDTYIALRYGDCDNYRVRPFPFQEEGNLPRELRCKVKSISSSGWPNLVQDLSEFLMDNYELDCDYSFTISNLGVDSNDKPYYELRDSFGLKHRFWYRGTPKYQVGDQHNFLVKTIDVEKGWLKLIDPDDAPAAVAPRAQIDPMPVDGEFGHEDLHTEFKTSIVYVPGDSVANIDKQCLNIVKELAAFMNAEGGKLYIGVNDSGVVTGINDDFAHLNEGHPDYDEYPSGYKMNTDHYALKIQNVVKKRCNNTANACLDFEFKKYDGDRIICIVTVKPSESPIFVNDTLLYQRAGTQKQLLKNDEITNFIRHRIGLDVSGKIQELIDSMGNSRSSVPKENFQVPVPVQSAQVATDDEIWNYFTWYTNGDWSFQKKKIDADDVVFQVDVRKSKKDGLLVMCYDNGCINLIKPSVARAKKETGRHYKNGWNQKARLVNVFISNANHLLGVFSKDVHGIEYAKIHRLSDFNPVATIGAQGSIIVNPKLGMVQGYKWVSYDNRHSVPNLLLAKSQTSNTLGLPVKSALIAGEVDALKGM